MELVLAEKPKVAKKIASALGGGKVRRGVGKAVYYELDGKIIASAVGHLFTLAEKEKSFDYPVFDVVWKPRYIERGSEHIRDWISTLQILRPLVSEVIVACDYDTEGSLIGYNVARFLFPSLPIRRMKFSTLTVGELRNSYERLQEFDLNNALAGDTRHTIDWYYGINLSRALMKALRKAGLKKVLSIGRVQGPTLHFVVHREREIEAFVPDVFYIPYIIVKGVKFTAGKCRKESEAKLIIQRVGKTAEVKKVERKIKEIKPPHPFDLTSLQTTAYAAFKFSPAKTLQLAQSLYENSYISYPRTSSQKLPASINYRTIIQKLTTSFPEAKELLSLSRLIPNNGPKDDPAHPAIYPTGLLGKMSNDEWKLYTLIVKRFLATFSKPAKKEIITVVLDASYLFSAQGERIVEEGFIRFYREFFSFPKEFPAFVEGGAVPIEKKGVKKEKTKPEPRYTEGSIIAELEKKKLGTKATRAVVVETLFQRDYFTKNGRSIVPTQLAFAVNDVLEKYVPEILDEVLTRKLEEKIEKIQQGAVDPKEVKAEARETLSAILEEFKKNEDAIGRDLFAALKKEEEKNYVASCPRCGKPMVIKYSKRTDSYFLGCTAFPKCKLAFSLPGKPKLTDKICQNCGSRIFKVRIDKRYVNYCLGKLMGKC